ncbi:hypothetical protein F5Y18DRAFT_397156 [Xylariaceae sp. FL1019]|nr:hypothetical protein F5Y18DRAFT_397156 [Xylariaceae sp. FL1019]
MDVATPLDVAPTCIICVIDIDLMKYLCDFLDIQSVARLIQVSKSLHSTLFEYLVKRTFLWHKNIKTNQVRDAQVDRIFRHTFREKYDFRERRMHSEGWKLENRIRPFQPPNLIVTAIRDQWSLDVVERVIKLALDLHPPMLNGTADCDKHDGIPPIIAAAEENRLDILSLLEEYGVDLDMAQKSLFSLDPCVCKASWKDLLTHRRDIDSQTHSYGASSKLCRRIIDVAIDKKDLGLTNAMLARLDLPVYRTSLTRTLFQGWLPGLHAFIASDRISRIDVQAELTQALCQNDTGSRGLGYPPDTPDWVETLITLGADPDPPKLADFEFGHPDSALKSMLARNRGGELSGALKLLDLVKFRDDSLLAALRDCVTDDSFLDVTKKILSDTEFAARAYKRALLSAFREKYIMDSPNEETIEFLMSLLRKLLKIGKIINFSEPVSSRRKRPLLEHAIQASASSRTDRWLPLSDWTVSLLRVGVTVGPPGNWSCAQHYRSAVSTTLSSPKCQGATTEFDLDPRPPTF